ncbi:uncharacterized protein LOC131598113 [Vicia villosa]|uniref:uncharacterized protein LOC131598113 n=1 Tax=Vicia villosa TaxID=3911 RepID=UPI00273BB083|nr:uncharacterized protein LOC131598113 [Vicia villosa]
MKNILPTKENLLGKGVASDGLCPLYQVDTENSCHLFLRCSFIKRVLFSNPLGIRVPEEGDVADWLDAIFTRKDFKLGQIVAIFMWKIWKVRNYVIFKNAKADPCTVAVDIWNAVSEESHSCLLAESRRNQPMADASSPKGWVVQTDAGCFEEGIISFGCVIRDPSSNIFLAATKRIHSVTNPATVEAMVIRWALQMAKDLGLSEFVIQSDALTVVDCINGCFIYADLNPIVFYCKVLLSSFNSVGIMFINRAENVEAHQLVGIGRSIGSRTWTGHIPNLCPVICNSLSVSV